MGDNTSIGTRELAKLWGLHKSTARRRLVELERKHGPTVVSRVGRRMWTTYAALESVNALRLASKEPFSNLVTIEMLAGVEVRVTALETTLRQFASMVRSEAWSKT